MGTVQFPPVEDAIDGLLALGGNLDTDTLVEAYKRGIFPWPFSQEVPVAWFSPDPRGVLDWEHLHIPHSMKKFIRKHSFEVCANQDFDQIISRCANISRKNQSDTWITPDMQEAYNTLFQKTIGMVCGML